MSIRFVQQDSIKKAIFFRGKEVTKDWQDVTQLVTSSGAGQRQTRCLVVNPMTFDSASSSRDSQCLLMLVCHPTSVRLHPNDVLGIIGSGSTSPQPFLAFDPVFYKNFYPDLQSEPESFNLRHHWDHFGIEEGRIPNGHVIPFERMIKEEYYPALFRLLNPDLSRLDDFLLFQVFIVDCCLHRNRKWSFHLLATFPFDEASSSGERFIVRVHDSTSSASSCIHERELYPSSFFNACRVTKRLAIDAAHPLWQKPVILIVDFPKFGGGTSTFLNAIVCRYRDSTTFLIARTFDDRVSVTLHEDSEIFYGKDSDACAFLDAVVAPVASKVFINHFIRHSAVFLTKVLQMPQEKAILFHDFLSLSPVGSCSAHHNDNDCSPYLHRAVENNTTSSGRALVNACDHILSQHQNNIPFFQKFLTGHKKITVCPLPDYKNTLDRISSEHRGEDACTIIAMIGNLIPAKGTIIVKSLLEHVIKHPHLRVRFVILGSNLHRENLDRYSSILTFAPYKDVTELNEHLQKYKPNMLFEASLWNETYNYTLTLACITDLPILYLRKNGQTVVEGRLSGYQKAVAYNNVNSFFSKVSSIRQDYFYTIDPVIHFPLFWDQYFLASP